jgi:hypothetical protein
MKHLVQSTEEFGSEECNCTTKFLRMLLPTFFRFNVNKWSSIAFVLDSNLNANRSLITAFSPQRARLLGHTRL